MTYRLTVSRDLVSGTPGNLVLPAWQGDGSPMFSLDPAFKPGHQETQPIWVLSPFTAPIQAGEVPQPAVMALGIHAHADDEQTLQNRMTEIVACFRQLTYTVLYEHLNSDGSISAHYRWRCGPASAGPGDGETFEDDQLAALTQAVQLTIPRTWVPLAGPF